MADEKKKADEAKTEPAAGPVGTSRSVSDDQMSTGPAPAAEAESDDPNATKTYYLRPGKTHSAVLKGERRTLDRAGQTAELTDGQYKAFKDKFFTKAEYDAHKAGEEALAEGAAAAVPVDRTTSENATPEERNAANNEAKGGKAGNTTSGETSKA